MAPRRLNPRRHKFSLSVEFFKVYAQKNLQATISFVDFTKAFDNSQRKRWSKFYNPSAYQKKPVAAIMMLYRNTKVKVRSLDGDTDYFDIVVGILQGDTLAPYLFIICPRLRAYYVY